ncbi:MAG: M48 family metallopeptidase [Alphaproteobacteria bacterium]|nr:M48 family metallopeptidase [Alphaproteobacteria bacterium]
MSLNSEPTWLATLALAALIVANTLVRFWLASRQIRHIARHADAVPSDFSASVGLPEHRKAAHYSLAKLRLGLLDIALDALVLLGWTLLGGLEALNQALLQWLDPGLMQQIALVVAFILIGGLIHLPMSLMETFGIEQRFGFNRTTPALWLSDMFKGVVLGLLLGVPILWVVLALMAAGGGWWWLWAWMALVAYQLIVMWIAPNVIMPLFNKFTPLEDEALKERVSALMARSGFTAEGFFVMDGSRRSAHSNAFFTGFGASKRVVFFDTLLKQLDVGEMEAVLAHELGHFKHRHVVKMMVRSFAATLLGLAALGWLTGQTWFYTGLGVTPLLTDPSANNALALVLFMLVLPLPLFFLNPLGSALSRRQEFEADAYAAKHARANDLRTALLKLYRDNASTLTPDPLYVAFYYSHPPAGQRLARLAGA